MTEPSADGGPPVDLTVADAPERSRYEAVTPGGVLVGFAAYVLDGPTATFTHTEIDPTFEGRGFGSVLAREALTDARRRGLRLVVLCPFLKDWIARHPGWDDGIAPAP